MRVGIGHPRTGVSGYVLGRFTPAEAEALRASALALAARCALDEALALRDPEST